MKPGSPPGWAGAAPVPSAAAGGEGCLHWGSGTGRARHGTAQPAPMWRPDVQYLPPHRTGAGRSGRSRKGTCRDGAPLGRRQASAGWRGAAGGSGSASWALAAPLSPLPLSWQPAPVTEPSRPFGKTNRLVPGGVTVLPLLPHRVPSSASPTEAPNSLYLRLYPVCMCTHTKKPT